jgi:predicted SAM-dependent methyltransferase
VISRFAKATFYTVMAWPMRLNGWSHRTFRGNKGTPLKVHLGPGQKNYLAGWCNVDANPFTAKIDVWADLRNKLPFRDGTVDAFYSHHVIEHLADDFLPVHFADMFRCLKPGGVIRVGGPNSDMAIDRYVAGDTAWFSDFPDKRSSLGGRLANYILCRGEHLTILTESYLREIAEGVGFRDVVRREPTATTGAPDIFDAAVMAKEWESSPAHPHTLLIEARKPS